MSARGPHKAARWLLWEIERQENLHDGWATTTGIVSAFCQHMTDRAPDVARSVLAGWADKGLRRLKAQGLAEKFHPPMWGHGQALPWRLTDAGRAELARRRAIIEERTTGA